MPELVAAALLLVFRAQQSVDQEFSDGAGRVETTGRGRVGRRGRWRTRRPDGEAAQIRATRPATASPSIYFYYLFYFSDYYALATIAVPVPGLVGIQEHNSEHATDYAIGPHAPFDSPCLQIA